MTIAMCICCGGVFFEGNDGTYSNQNNNLGCVLDGDTIIGVYGSLKFDFGQFEVLDCKHFNGKEGMICDRCISCLKYEKVINQTLTLEEGAAAFVAEIMLEDIIYETEE